jgi:anti-sigma factor RsiW
MAACADQELLLGGLVDNELDAANVAMVEAHVARCEACREELYRLQALRDLLRGEGVRHVAPESLARRIAELLELSPKAANDGAILGWLGPAFAGALAASLAMLLFIPPSTQTVVDQEIVSSHVRSLQPGHLTDVQTTNQHIVKPWFNGKIDFSPPVPELADAGFPLAGGRLDSLDGKTVAAIVYHRRLHTVNLYVWPAKDSAERSFVKDGFAVSEWSRNGLRYAAISDIPPAEVQQFHRLFEQRSS